MNLSKMLTAKDAKQIVRTTIQTDIEIKSQAVLDQIFNAIQIYAKKGKSILLYDLFGETTSLKGLSYYEQCSDIIVASLLSNGFIVEGSTNELRISWE